jgi:hypothetical protein
MRAEQIAYELTDKGRAAIGAEPGRRWSWSELNRPKPKTDRRHRPQPSQPCGTRAAYTRHRRNGETPCRPCRDAAAADNRARKGA